MRYIKALCLAVKLFGQEYRVQQEGEQETHTIYTWSEAWSRAKGVYL